MRFNEILESIRDNDLTKVILDATDRLLNAITHIDSYASKHGVNTSIHYLLVAADDIEPILLLLAHNDNNSLKVLRQYQKLQKQALQKCQELAKR